MGNDTVSRPRLLFDKSLAVNPQMRRARLLGWILLTQLAIVMITIVIVIVINQQNLPRLTTYTILCVSILLVIIAAYWLNRRGYYKLAASSTVFIAFIGNWASILLNPQVLKVDVVPLSYIVIPVLICALFLSMRFTIILISLQLTGLFLLFLFVPALRPINWTSLIVFTMIVSSIGLVSSIVGQRDLRYMDKQNKKLVMTEAQLRVISEKDSLTGLYNRYYLEEALEQEIDIAKETGHAVGIILLDIDFFKQINDTFGHIAGDEILKGIGDILQKHIRSTDIACRFGGDEFVIILPEAAQEAAYTRAQDLREIIKAIPFEINTHDLTPIYDQKPIHKQHQITISAGVAVFPDHGITISGLLSAADAALYRAKREGRNRVILAEAPTGSEATSSRLSSV